MHKKLKLIMGGTFFMVGVICGIILVVTTINRLGVISDSERVVARVVDYYHTGESTVAFIEYKVGGTIISATMNWGDGHVRVGQTVDIFVSRHNPHSFIEGGVSGWITQIVMFPFMAIFGGIGAMFLIMDIRARAMRKWLFQHGTPVWANVQDVVADWSMRVNGQPATVLKATHKFMQFTSTPLDNNDLMHIGEHVKVLLHPEKPKFYAFDIHGESRLLPERAPEPPSVGVAW